MRQKYKQQPIAKGQLKNPYSKPNPYRIKAKLYSSQSKQNKFITKQSSYSVLTHNPQSLLYKRNYNQSPILHYDNYVSTNNRLPNNNTYTKDPINNPHLDYRVRLKQYFTQNFCPSDPYLQTIKDKFIHFNNNNNSQFQTLMRLSSFNKIQPNSRNNGKIQDRIRYHSVSENQGSKVHSLSRSMHNGTTQNPFLRKNLLTSAQATNFLEKSHSIYSHYLTQSQVNYYYSNSNNFGNIVNQTLIKSGHHNEQVEMKKITSINSNPVRRRQSSFSGYDNNILTKVVSGYENGSVHQLNNVYQNNSFCNPNNYDQNKNEKIKTQMDNKISPKSLESYNPIKKRMSTYIDAVIQKQLDDKDKIQQRAPKQIKINGKAFHFNYTKRLVLQD